VTEAVGGDDGVGLRRLEFFDLLEAALRSSVNAAA
jgi:hypothetical protein